MLYFLPTVAYHAHCRHFLVFMKEVFIMPALNLFLNQIDERLFCLIYTAGIKTGTIFFISSSTNNQKK